MHSNVNSIIYYFIINYYKTKILRQSKYLSADEWIKKGCVCVCVCVYYSGIKKLKFCICNNIGGLGGVILSEINQREKHKYCFNLYVEYEK